MARLPRLTLPGYPHHAIQRGNNRQPIFLGAADYEAMQQVLLESSRRFAVAMHAYVLMENHFHLLATPQTEDGFPKMMQAVGRSYVRYFNQMHQRSGTLWEGRYRSTLIQPERYLLACMAYMDLNPVRAGVVSAAGDYPWSSHRFYLGQRVDKLVTPHALFWDIGNTPFAREDAYAKRVQAGINPQLQGSLSDSTLQGWALGDPEFIKKLQDQTPRRLTKGRAGRPVSVSKLSVPD